MKRTLLIAVAVLLCACTESDKESPAKATAPSAAMQATAAADTVYINGQIYTVNKAQPWAEAIAIKEDKFLFVGSNEAVQSVVGDHTEVVDLKGAFVMPGIIDLHSHPFLTPWYGSMNLKLQNPGDEDLMLAEIKAYAEAHPDKPWIIGGQYNLGVFAGDKPGKGLLDNIVPDRPVAILDQTGHSMWLNSKALELAGIDANTETSSLIIIDKNADTGEPLGAVFEQAIQLVERQIPQASAEEYAEVVEGIFDMFISYGITAQQTAEGLFFANIRTR